MSKYRPQTPISVMHNKLEALIHKAHVDAGTRGLISAYPKRPDKKYLQGKTLSPFY
jgi:hypothetical protein